MMHTLKRILAMTLGLAAAAACACYFSVNHIVKSGIERMGPLLTGTEVKVRSVRLFPLTGKGRLSGLVIGNPPGFKSDAAFRVNTVRVELDLSSLLTDTWVIRRVVVDRPEFTYEASMGGSNVAKIQENVEKFSPPGDSKAGSRKYLIERFVVKGGSVRMTAKLLDGKALSVPMGDLDLKDIGSKDGRGASLRDAAVQVFSPLASSVSKATLEQGKTAVEDVRERAAEGLKSLKKLFK